MMKRGMVSRPVRRARHEGLVQLANQHGGRLEVDAFVLADHRQTPARRIHLLLGIFFFVDGRMVAHDVEDHVARAATIFDHVRKKGPLLRRLLDDVVPAHLVDARLENALEVSAERLAAQTGHAQLIDRQRRRVPEVKDQRMPQPVRGGLVEGALRAERRKEHLRQRPPVFEVVFQVLPGGRPQVRKPQRPQRSFLDVKSRALLRRQAREHRRVGII
mmetsp:Transcript_6131/g.19232  ORF Transcript_6131/g.19232 Transcript_6131/m.19232 type:complete len:217 (+) Transcript_6131:1917-2567(+)